MLPPAYLAIGFLSRPVVRLLFRLRAEGVENLPAGGFVLSANHVSNFDAWPLGLPLFPRRQLRFMAKAELYRGPLRWVLDSAGAFRVRRGVGDEEAIRTAIQLARDGEVVAIFPEGTRREKGLRKKFRSRPHTGAARVALAAGVPLVPAAISGTDRLSRLGPVRVRYGLPVELGDLVERRPREAIQLATERLMEAIDRLGEDDG